ncbi:MAG: ATP synthase F1 subunit gamma [Phototrophicales bacterium]|nr:MAG: ATP synthase F1 subunit gamma [Phototrophicales bacterium]
MATVKEIKRRIRSVNNIAQVTRALEAVSASRVRRAQEQVMNTRAYASKAAEVLANVAATTQGSEHPLLAVHDRVKAINVILITSDRSLCGSYNDNIIRLAERFVANHEDEEVRWIAVGRKGRDYLVRRGHNVIAEFTNLPTPLRVADIIPISNIILDEFNSFTTDQVFIAYTDFINTLTQRPTIFNLLPLKPYAPKSPAEAMLIRNEPEVTVQKRDYLYEPSPTAILDEVIPRFVTLLIYQAFLESAASEHSARMVAMRNASENAIALSADLTLAYNKLRQAAITSEILDIVGGVNALDDSDVETVNHLADRFIEEVGTALRNP